MTDLERTVSADPCLALILQCLEERKMQDVVSVLLPSHLALADYMVIANGYNERHNRATAEHIRQALKDGGYEVLGMEGQDDGEWLVLDYGLIVIHLFTPPVRKFYDLDGLWAADWAVQTDQQR